MKNLIAVLIFIAAFHATAQQQGNAPYLEILSENALIPLKESKTNVTISGTIAHVEVTQVYRNTGNIPVEANYVFPLSTQAAVHQMQMKIGERIVNAKIFEKKEARKVYTEALNSGKRAAKLEQSRPNVFQMKVGNIMPGDVVSIVISYTEMLLPVNGSYQFVAPGVVGPRFTGEGNPAENTFRLPYTRKGISDTFHFDMQLTLHAGMTIQNIHSPSHKVHVAYPHAKTATVFLSKSNRDPANRDFILNYSLRGNSIQSGLLLYEHEDEKFFAYLLEPMKNATLRDLPSREYLFIVDVSGSMNGYPLEVARELMRNLLCNLSPGDTFNVQLFASSATIFHPLPVAANGDNIERAIKFLSHGQGGGGTELLHALQTAYTLPRNDPGSSRSMVVITDGYVNVEREAFELIRQHLDQANVFTFGIGSSVNRYLIEGMAKVSNSQSFIATSFEEARAAAGAFKEYISSPVLTQVRLKAKGFDIYDVQPATIPDVFSARPVVVFGKYRGEAKGKLILTGYRGRKKVSQENPVAEGEKSEDNRALRYLWARKKIEQMDDYRGLFGADVEAQVLGLGLRYQLATRYTSFVAVDEQIVNKDGSLKSVNQPLPMPQYVENSAVGAAAEVSETFIFTKSASLSFDTVEPLSKTEERQLTLWFKAHYLTRVYKHLSGGPLRIVFGKEGRLLRVERYEKRQWMARRALTKEFGEIAVSQQPVNCQFSVIVRQ